MQSLEQLYDKTPKINNFHVRKVQIENKKTLLIGSKKSGISSIIFDHLNRYPQEEVLYINLQDKRILTNELKNTLSSFLIDNPIKLLVIEHYDKTLPLPNVDEIILSTNDISINIEGFETLHVEPLDFEEFLAFDTRHTNVRHLFNLYANHGRLPSSVSLEEHQNLSLLQETLHVSLMTKQTFEIFKFFALHQSQNISINKVYLALKETMKLSKDTIYKVSQELQNQDLLHLIEKYNSPKSAKKVFLTNFAYKNALTFEKDFQRRFQNIVFCELTKLKTDMFYEQNIDFFIPSHNLAIICIPFTPPELIARRFTRMLSQFQSLHVNKVQVITVGNESSFTKDEIFFEILPFWDWSLQLT